MVKNFLRTLLHAYLRYIHIIHLLNAVNMLNKVGLTTFQTAAFSSHHFGVMQILQYHYLALMAGQNLFYTICVTIINLAMIRAKIKFNTLEFEPCVNIGPNTLP